MTIQGSKVKYAKYIIPILQKRIDNNNIATFVDCCCGGANIIKQIKCQNRIAIDINPYLIALLQEMQKDDFIFPKSINREDWDRCKSGNESRQWFIGLVSIFCSYFTRGFSSGYCNDVHPDGRYYYEERCRTAQKDIPLIKDITFINNSFEKILEYENCVIYCDPPYESTAKYDFSKNFDYKKFWETVRQTSLNNYVFISEQSAPEDFIPIWTKESLKHVYTNQKKAPETLFTYKFGLEGKLINDKNN